MKSFTFTKKPKSALKLDPHFYPIILNNLAFEEAVNNSTCPTLVKISLERSNQQFSTYELFVFNEEENQEEANFIYIERFVKTILWLKGGFRLYFSGSPTLGRKLKEAYSTNGLRAFDEVFMTKVYDHPFEVVLCKFEEVPSTYEISYPVGRHLDGYRIGFDAGGSDRKVSAVVNGEAIFSEEVVWSPKIQSDPSYHYQGIMDSLQRAASKMPRVDAIGVSSAGIYIDNRVAVASLFRKVPDDLFEKEIKNIFFRIKKEFGDIPINVQNDGDVTALAGAMSLNKNNVLGIAMGTSEAAGYVDQLGNITGWLNELSFVPVDYYPHSFRDEWSMDYGVGVGYFSQDAVIKLAQNNGFVFDDGLSPAEKLKVIQHLAKKQNPLALEIFHTIGVYLGYELAYYARFYEIDEVLILGRVTSGVGGDLVLKSCLAVLKDEFPDLAKTMNVSLPSEMNRRVGQSIAAASLPEIKEEVMK
ncbi:MAG: ROK family protein [Candidatus Izemoplasmatales bacterium]